LLLNCGRNALRQHIIEPVHTTDADAAAAACAVSNGYYVMQLVHAATRDTLHSNPRHSEITALCCLWLRAVAALDETNDRAANSKIGDRSYIRSEPILIYGDRH